MMDWINDSGKMTSAKSQLNSFVIKEKLGEYLILVNFHNRK